jgi:putative PIN family toxin of toxin-antitoxin system
VFTALREGRFVPVVSRLLLDEITEVLDRPRLRRLRGMNDADLATLLALLEDRVIEVLLAGDLHLCRDPEDDFLLETAIRGGARFVVSRDDNLKRDLDLMARLRGMGSRC